MNINEYRVEVHSLVNGHQEAYHSLSQNPLRYLVNTVFAATGLALLTLGLLSHCHFIQQSIPLLGRVVKSHSIASLGIVMIGSGLMIPNIGFLVLRILDRKTLAKTKNLDLEQYPPECAKVGAGKIGQLDEKRRWELSGQIAINGETTLYYTLDQCTVESKTQTEQEVRESVKERVEWGFCRLIQGLTDYNARKRAITEAVNQVFQEEEFRHPETWFSTKQIEHAFKAHLHEFNADNTDTWKDKLRKILRDFCKTRPADPRTCDPRETLEILEEDALLSLIPTVDEFVCIHLTNRIESEASTATNIQFALKRGDQLTLANHGDKLAFAVVEQENGRKAIPLCEAQSENPRFKEGHRTVITHYTLAENSHFVLGVRHSRRRLQDDLDAKQFDVREIEHPDEPTVKTRATFVRPSYDTRAILEAYSSLNSMEVETA